MFGTTVSTKRGMRWVPPTVRETERDGLVYIVDLDNALPGAEVLFVGRDGSQTVLMVRKADGSWTCRHSFTCIWPNVTHKGAVHQIMGALRIISAISPHACSLRACRLSRAKGFFLAAGDVHAPVKDPVIRAHAARRIAERAARAERMPQAVAGRGLAVAVAS